MTTGTPRKPPVFGPEPWSELAGRSWSYWDLWFAAVAVADYADSRDDLEAHLVGELRSHVDGRQGAESKLSHLADLRRRPRCRSHPLRSRQRDKQPAAQVRAEDWLAHSAVHNANLWPVLTDNLVGVPANHAKVRRDGYRKALS